jgi:hypothetical protein
MVTRQAAKRYGYELEYQSRPRWNTYAGVLAFARRVRDDLRDLRPRDMIDLQSFLWVQGSDEYLADNQPIAARGPELGPSTPAAGR